MSLPNIFLHPITLQDSKEIFKNCKKVDFKKDEFLFHIGDKIEYLDLLVDGSIQIFKYFGNSNEVTLTYFNPGNLIAEWAVVKGIPYPASGRFTKNSTICRMPIEEFHQRLANDFHLNHFLMRSLLNKIDTLNLAINRGLTMDSVNRVADFLYRSFEQSKNLKQHQIASLLYLRPETLSRVLRQFKESGIITMENNQIIVQDREKLKGILEDESK